MLNLLEKLSDIDKELEPLPNVISDLAEAYYQFLGPERSGTWDQKFVLPPGMPEAISKGFTVGFTSKMSIVIIFIVLTTTNNSTFFFNLTITFNIF